MTRKNKWKYKNLGIIILNPHFWILLIIFLVLIILHYPQALLIPIKIEINSFFGLERHAIERILFLVPISYAAFVFGLKGGILCLAASLILMIPRVFFISVYIKDSLFETILTIGTGILINWWMESRRREIGLREQTLLKLRAMQEDLRLYADQINSAYEEERKRIARDLHDDTIQTLIAISRRLDNFISENASKEKDLLKPLEKINISIDGALIRIRRFVQDLRPPTLEYLGLYSALRELVTHIQEQSNIKIQLKAEELKFNLTPEKELLIYRIIQEGIRNVWKHSKATEAEVIITSNEKQTSVEIHDNGKGFDLNNNVKFLEMGKLGLMGIRERAHLLGGSLDIISKPDKGTVIKILLDQKNV